MNAWSHLANARHIDWVLKSLKTHPEVWAAAYNTAQNDASPATYNAAYNTAHNDASPATYYAARHAAWDAARHAALHMAWYAASGAILALVAYDHASKYFDMPSDQVRVWVVLSEEPAAILMLSAVILREQIEQVERV